MNARLNYAQIAPEAYNAVRSLNDHVVHKSGLDPLLIDLIKLRASQINGCAFCVDMHAKEARAHGASEQWIIMVSAWQESPVFTAKERAVLGWTESLTRIADTRAPDDAYEPLGDFFTPAEIVEITVAIGVINVWNRLAVGFRSQHKVDAPARAA